MPSQNWIRACGSFEDFHESPASFIIPLLHTVMAVPKGPVEDIAQESLHLQRRNNSTDMSGKLKTETLCFMYITS